MTSRTLLNANCENRPILEAALVNHRAHYWSLCQWVSQELKKPARSRKFHSGPHALSMLLGEGHTAATVIWETYAGEVPT